MYLDILEPFEPFLGPNGLFHQLIAGILTGI